MGNQTDEMAGKNCLITGSSRGIGFYTALGLARKGAHVIVVSHNRERSQAAADKINQAVGEGSARYYVADLSSQAEIRALADKIKGNYDHLDVLVNNVGGWFTSYQESPDGIEMTFALNHLSYFLLTGLLLDLLLAAQSARIVNVSSYAHRQLETIQFEDLQFKTKFKTLGAYAQSKLANLLFTYALAERLSEQNITVNALHPGFISSELYRHYTLLRPVILLLTKLFGKNEQQGAQTSIYLASAPEVAGVTGKYFSDQQEAESSPGSHDPEAAEKLWEISEKMTGFTYPV